MAADDDNDIFAKIRRKLAEKRAKEKRGKKKKQEHCRQITRNWQKKDGKAQRTKQTAEIVANAEESAVDIDQLGVQLREAREREERRNAAKVKEWNARKYAKRKSTTASIATSRSGTIGENEESSQRTSVRAASVDDGLSNKGVVTTSKEDKEDPLPFERHAYVRCDGSCGKNVSYSQFGGRMEQCFAVGAESFACFNGDSVFDQSDEKYSYYDDGYNVEEDMSDGDTFFHRSDIEVGGCDVGNDSICGSEFLRSESNTRDGVAVGDDGIRDAATEPVDDESVDTCVSSSDDLLATEDEDRSRLLDLKLLGEDGSTEVCIFDLTEIKLPKTFDGIVGFVEEILLRAHACLIRCQYSSMRQIVDRALVCVHS